MGLHLKQRLARHVRGWIGGPRPDKSHWEMQYKSGRWSYLHQLQELGHYSVIAGYIKYLKHGASVLDLGCGDGILAERLDTNSYSEYVGVDLSEVAISHAQARAYARASFESDDIERYVPRRSFDVIVFNESLYYLGDPLGALARYRQYLKPRGMFIVSMYLPPRAPLWRRIGRQYPALDETRVRNREGTEWVCRVLAPQRVARERHSDEATRRDSTPRETARGRAAQDGALQPLSPRASGKADSANASPP